MPTRKNLANNIIDLSVNGTLDALPQNVSTRAINIIKNKMTPNVIVPDSSAIDETNLPWDPELLSCQKIEKNVDEFDLYRNVYGYNPKIIIF